MFTVSNALLMSNATAMVRVGGMGWLKPVATVLLRYLEVFGGIWRYLEVFGGILFVACVGVCGCVGVSGWGGCCWDGDVWKFV